jgi:hypothetical protein
MSLTHENKVIGLFASPNAPLRAARIIAMTSLRPANGADPRICLVVALW